MASGALAFWLMTPIALHFTTTWFAMDTKLLHNEKSYYVVYNFLKTGLPMKTHIMGSTHLCSEQQYQEWLTQVKNDPGLKVTP